MIWNDFVEHYMEEYSLIFDRQIYGPRLKGQTLYEIKMLVYILRAFYNVPYSIIARKLVLHKASAQRFYSDVLITPIYRNEAEGRYKRCSEHLNALTKQSA
jgi:hypothetical protein